MRRTAWLKWLLLGAAVLPLCCARGVSQADEVDGRWSGRFSLLGNYYWETSTRVVAPEFGVQLTSPNGTDLSATYLVDTITSASQAAGTTIDVSFNETRHDITLGAGRELELGDSALQLRGGLHFSREPDYTSISGNVGASLFLNERSTTLHLTLGYLHDEVRQNFRGPPPPTVPGLILGQFNEDFDALTISIGWDQVLQPWLIAEVGYDLVYLNGFLANAYRRVMVAGAAVGEQHPGTRIRHTLTGRLKAHVQRTRTTFQLRYRAYLDSWDIGAINPEVRVYQQLARNLDLRLRYRYYKQTRSFFYEDDDEAYAPNAAFFTNDPKMSAFRSHEIGMQLRLGFGFLEGTALDVLRGGRLDLSFNYLWRTNVFGDAVTAQVGLSVPF
ncbi:MAG: DUF3570 domain-containing protein [Sandaracinaceae bacterium]|jgi:hypothetical protein|nr:DUF3570 domain-containing protein [Sandaracinaceae bacterium]